MAWTAVLLMILAAISGCNYRPDLRYAYIPPEPIKAEAFQVHQEIAFSDELYVVKAWMNASGEIVVCRRYDVLRYDAGGALLGAVKYEISVPARVLDAGESQITAPGAVLAWEAGGESWLDANYGWVAVARDGKTVRSGTLPRPMRPVESGGISGTWR